MRLIRLFAYLIACVAFGLSFLIYMDYIHGLGFPDGFITELGHAQRRLAYLFIGVSIILGLYFIYLGWTAKRKSIARRLPAAIILYLIAIIATALVDYYYRAHLMGSTGG
jgi:hypothetical protein